MSKLNLAQAQAYNWMQDPCEQNRRRIEVAAREAALEPDVIGRAMTLEDEFLEKWLVARAEFYTAYESMTPDDEAFRAWAQRAQEEMENARKGFEAMMIAKDFVAAALLAA